MRRIAFLVALLAITPSVVAQQCRNDCIEKVQEESIEGAPPAKAPANIKAGFCNFMCACISEKLDMGVFREFAQGRTERMQAQQTACLKDWARGNEDAAVDYSRKRVLVCTPWDGSADAIEARTDGRYEKHWKAVDRQLTALKGQKNGPLHKAGAQAKEVVTVLLNGYREPKKLREIILDRDCPPEHGVLQRDFEKWMRAPGREGK